MFKLYGWVLKRRSVRDGGAIPSTNVFEALSHGDAVGPTIANVGVGVLSAIVDNIPVMFAVLAMNPETIEGKWLLVTRTAGVGGSMLSIGSAAGVAPMSTARGKVTFLAHLRWSGP